MGLAPIRLTLSGPGRGRVVVDGVDLSDKVSALSLIAADGDVPRLLLELHVGAAEIDGLTDVTVVRAGADDLADFFAHIDAGELEKEALSRMGGFDDTTVTRTMLDVLAEWAAGR